ncbi:MAG: methyltransferase family protein [Paracoccaceae bacterium]
MNALRHLDYPPVWLVAHMAVASFMAHVWAPLAGWGLIPGGLLIAAGVALMVWAALSFRKAETTLVPRRDPSALVTEGPYARSRNPIYLADLIILAGWAIAQGSLVALVLLVPLWRVLEGRFVRPEEATLAAHLGAPYEAYKARVPRWL